MSSRLQELCGYYSNRLSFEEVGRLVERLTVLLNPKLQPSRQDIVMWEKATEKFEYIAAPINEAGEDLLSLTSVVKPKLMQEYGRETTPLNLVAITDGARTIRYRLFAIFGATVRVILDWYHLCNKLRELMSMIAINKLKKAKHLKFLLSQL